MSALNHQVQILLEALKIIGLHVIKAGLPQRFFFWGGDSLIGYNLKNLQFTILMAPLITLGSKFTPPPQL